MKPSLYFAGFLLSLVGVPCEAAEQPALHAGAAMVEISPQTLPALQNGGFLERRSNRVVDPLHARTLVVSDGVETIAIVIVDSCMFPTPLCDQIKRLASKDTGIPTDRILISATHTHTAPAAMACLGCEADEAYVKYVPARVAQSIVQAYENLQPAKLGWKAIDGSDLTNCRRWITRSDRMEKDPFGEQTVRAMMHPGYQNPSYACPAGPIDPWLSILSVVSAKDDSPICVMANFSMHYFGGGGFSADYFGEVAGLLKARIGKLDDKTGDKTVPRFVGIMSQGTSGDLHWMGYSKPNPGTNRQQYSQAIAERILQAWKTIEHQSVPSIAMAEKRITIDRRVPSQGRREWARPINAGRGDLPPRNRVEVYAMQTEWMHENPQAEVVLQAVRLGDLGITAIPNEVYGITGLKLKRQSPLPATFNLELANGATGYIPPPEQHQLGGYTTWPASTAGLDEQAEPLIVEELLSLLESVSGKKRRSLVESDSAYAKAVSVLKPAAYWRLNDMVAATAKDTAGTNDARFEGAVAMFLPETTDSKAPEADFGQPGAYGNRCVYLAGGHIAANLKVIQENYSISMSFWNAMPTDARDTTGVLFSSDSETLLIAGKSAGDDSGKLMLKVGENSFVGKTPVSAKHWQHVAIVRAGKRLSVYLDGNAKPEIEVDAAAETGGLVKLLVGSDGDTTNNFDGKVDEVAVFDRSLTNGEITQLYAISGLTVSPRPKPTVVLGPKPTDAASRKKYAEAVLASKPVAYWRLHDASSESEALGKAKDAIGNFDAKYEKNASPLLADATKQNFNGGRVKANVLDLGNTYSVELWFRNELPVDSRPVTGYLFSRAADGVDGSPGDNLGIGGTHSNTGRLIVFNGNERGQLAAGRTRIAMGSWSHVVLVREGQKIGLYLNGDTEPEITAELPIGYPEKSEEVFFGGRSDNFANLQGMLEDVAVYDRALTPQEVAAHFKAAEVKAVLKNAIGQAKRVEEPTPTKPKDAVSTIRIRDGYKVELVAAEPLIKDPVAIDWGADGKLWVVEMADYPMGIDGKGKPGGRVRFLEDTNDDGKYDKSTLFAEGLSFPNGVLAWGRGVLITAAPEIVYLEDSTGDGKADVRRVLYSGFLEGNQQLRVNGLRWGLDNWVYCASGSHHGGYGKDSQITSQSLGKKYQIGSRDFRVRPRTGAIDPQSGPSQYGRNRDDWGNWFGVQNSRPLWHYVLADHHIRRNPHFAPPDPRHQVVTPVNPKVYPASKSQKRYHSFTQSGRFTSACSPMIYRDDLLFDRSDEQHAFTCEPFHNLVQHNLIADDGVSFKFRRDPAETKTDFFASEDRWCRPVMVRTGPDGALWVVDIYRYMIEHPEWLPQNGKDELRRWYRSGEDRGRIYRVVRSDRPARKIPRLAKLSTTKLVAAMESSNGWQRDTAQRLLVLREQRTAVAPLNQLATTSRQPLARLHALWTLDGLGSLSTGTLEAALNDSYAGVRRNAVRIAARNQVDVNRLAALVDDPDAKIRLELATTLGYYDSSLASRALAQLAITSSDDPYLTAAVMSSLNPHNVLDVLFAAIDSEPRNGMAMSGLIGQAIAMGDKETIDSVIEKLITQQNGTDEKQQFELLSLVRDALVRRKWPIDKLSIPAKESIAKITQQARTIAVNIEMPADIRAAAVQLLGRDQSRQESDFQLMQRLLVPQSPSSIQQAVVTNLSRRSERSVPKILLAGWRSHGPEIRGEILDAIASRKPWAEVLRERLEDGTIQASELSAPVRQRLLSLNGNSQQWQKALTSKASTSRADIVQQFQPALKLTGDFTRGGAVFRKKCISCHKLKNEGHEVGPQLASITNRTKEALFTSILDPNAAVDAKYFNYSVVTKDGRSFSGKLETETGSSITLLAAEEKRTAILRRDIEVLQATSKSIMPEGLEQELTTQDMADLIQFVREAFRN